VLNAPENRSWVISWTVIAQHHHDPSVDGIQNPGMTARWPLCYQQCIILMGVITVMMWMAVEQADTRQMQRARGLTPR